MTQKTKSDGIYHSDSVVDLDEIENNIAITKEIISKLTVTTNKSRAIMQRVSAFYRTQKMVESTNDLHISTNCHIRRYRVPD
jgi:hypothetical protein